MSLTRIIKASALFLAPVAAFAHPGHDQTTLLQGALHPIAGIDHALAMIATGIWAAQQGGRMRWIAPLSFVAMMSIGTLIAAAGMTLPQIEIGVTASIVVLGAAIAFALRAHPIIGATIVGAFAIFHGYAHGVEANNVSASFVAGMLAATAALHAIGIGVAVAIKQNINRQALRWTGASIALGGLALAFVA